jgi:hypothetical protein
MLVGIASIIMSIGTSITLFIQTLSLSRCKTIECCSVSCTQEGMWFGKQEDQEEQESEGDNNNMQVSVD